jgi:condensin-2 complex subunit D3
MLQNLDDEARFQLTFRLTRDVLHGVVEEVMSLKNASTEAVLKDALAVLSCDDIKLASLSASTDDDPVEKEDIAQAIVQSTKKAIIAQVSTLIFRIFRFTKSTLFFVFGDRS